MSTKNDFIWKAIQVVCWFIFAGYCVQTGALIFNFVYSLFKPIATHNLHLGLDLSDVYQNSKSFYTILFLLIIAVSSLKSYLFYLVIKLFKTINLVKPFSEDVSAFISRITFFSFVIGLISMAAHRLTKELSGKGFDISMVDRYWSDWGAYLMMSAILFVISLIFKKGIELQHENDLTV